MDADLPRIDAAQPDAPTSPDAGPPRPLCGGFSGLSDSFDGPEMFPRWAVYGDGFDATTNPVVQGDGAITFRSEPARNISILSRFAYRLTGQAIAIHVASVPDPMGGDAGVFGIFRARSIGYGM